MILKFIGWLLVALIGIVLAIVFLPLILLFIVIIFILSLFGQPVVRVWTSKARAGATAGAETVRSKISEHSPSKAKQAKLGQRKAMVVDANVIDMDK